jgi:uncharacterized protein YjiS (DUF1127 family)
MNMSENAHLTTDGQLPIVRMTRAWLAWLSEGLGRLGASWTARRRRSREVQELTAFSDRELWDLGLGRADLQAIINGTYHRD